MPPPARTEAITGGPFLPYPEPFNEDFPTVIQTFSSHSLYITTTTIRRDVHTYASDHHSYQRAPREYNLTFRHRNNMAVKVSDDEKRIFAEADTSKYLLTRAPSQ